MTPDFRELCQKVYDYHKGNSPYNYTQLTPYHRDNAAFDALSVIMEEIRAALKDTETTTEFTDLANKIIEKVHDQTSKTVVIDFSNLESTFNAYTYKIIVTVLQTITYNCHKFCFGKDPYVKLIGEYHLYLAKSCIISRLDTIAGKINEKISEVSPPQKNP